VLAALLGSAGLAFWVLRRDTPPPPEVDLTGTDPAVAAAIETVRARVQQAPRDARAWGLLGMVLYAHEYAGESVLCFRQAQNLDARQPRWPYFLGIALAATDPVAALPELRRAVDLWGEGETAPRLRLANLLLSLGQVDEAEEQFRIVLRQAPDAAAQLGLARVAVERNQPEEALKRLETCLADPVTQRPARSPRR
jgi:tetratricopeptide (TPR) repeat protein